MHINDLPDDCLRKIFEKEPLSRLLRYKGVCRRWQALVDAICASKQSLKIVHDFFNIGSYCRVLLDLDLLWHSDLKVSTELGLHDDILPIGARVVWWDIGRHGEVKPNNTDYSSDQQLANELIQSFFPKIKKLMLYLEYLPKHLFPHLFNNWPELSCLTLFGPNCSEALDWPWINSLSSLRSLHLINLQHFKIPSQVPALAQLENFSLVSYRHDIVPVLNQLGTNLKLLVLHEVSFPLQFDELYIILKRFSNTLQHLTLGNVKTAWPTLQQFASICTIFSSSLTRICLINPKLTPNSIISEITKLKYLTHFTLFTESNFELILPRPVSTVRVLHFNQRCVNNQELTGIIPSAEYSDSDSEYEEYSSGIPFVACYKEVFPNAVQVLVRTHCISSWHWAVKCDLKKTIDHIVREGHRVYNEFEIEEGLCDSNHWDELQRALRKIM